MELKQLLDLLDRNANALVEFVLPDHRTVESHYHLTEVGKVDKRFIDCGGTIREEGYCSLQLWSANDLDHRLTASKIRKILDLAMPILNRDDLEVRIEYGSPIASTYVVTHAATVLGKVELHLAGIATNCLAKDRCGVDATCC